MDLARKTNPNIEVRRARFSNIERAHIIRAAQHPVELDARQAAAVSARIELDLRIGAAFTRWQTMLLQSVSGLSEQLLSYGEFSRPDALLRTSLTGRYRLLPVSDPGVCRGPIQEGQELRPGALLEHKSSSQ